MNSLMGESRTPENPRQLDWLIEEFTYVDWRGEFLQERQDWRMAKKAVSDISANNGYSELERQLYLNNARDVLWITRLQSAISASMYLLTKSRQK